MKKAVHKSATAVTRNRSKARPVAASVPEKVRLHARAHREADMIRSALAHLPALGREAMGVDPFPFNQLASSEPVIDVVLKIVRRRIPGNPWNDAHRALISTDQNGKGYAEFTDAVRDVSFMAGVDYALSSLPSWWDAFMTLPDQQRRDLGTIIERTARVMTEDATDGAR